MEVRKNKNANIKCSAWKLFFPQIVDVDVQLELFFSVAKNVYVKRKRTETFVYIFIQQNTVVVICEYDQKYLQWLTK